MAHRDEGNILIEPHNEEQFVSDPVRLDDGAGEVSREEYIFYLRARKRLIRNEPIAESTFTDVQNPVLRRRLVRAICLKKANLSTTSATSEEPTPETT